jgi:hypothetical protein
MCRKKYKKKYVNLLESCLLEAIQARKLKCWEFFVANRDGSFGKVTGMIPGTSSRPLLRPTQHSIEDITEIPHP